MEQPGIRSYSLQKTKIPSMYWFIFGASILAIFVGAIFSFTTQHTRSDFLSFNSLDNGHIKAVLQTRTSGQVLADQNIVEGEHYSFKPSIAPDTYKISFSLIPHNATEKTIGITVDPDTTSLIIQATGFSDYQDWSILVDEKAFFPDMPFDWSGRGEMVLPLYKKPFFDLCIEASKTENTSDMKLCHHIVREGVS